MTSALLAVTEKSQANPNTILRGLGRALGAALPENDAQFITKVISEIAGAMQAEQTRIAVASAITRGDPTRS